MSVRSRARRGGGRSRGLVVGLSNKGRDRANPRNALHSSFIERGLATHQSYGERPFLRDAADAHMNRELAERMARALVDELADSL